MSKWIMALLLLFCLVSLTIAETPYSGDAGFTGSTIARVEARQNQTDRPVWRHLASMDFGERQNANIDVDLIAGDNPASRNLANEIEMVWNAGRHEEALGMFPGLQTLVGSAEIAIGISWKTALKNTSGNQAALWEQDVRINYQDSVYGTTLSAHQTTGNLFSVLLLQDGPFQLFSVNFSADEGATWAETYYYVSADILPSVGSAVMGQYCYIAFPVYNSIRLKCFNALNGYPSEFIDSTMTVRICNFNEDDTLKEINLISNQNQYNNRLYCSAITNRGRLIFNWTDIDAIAWNEIQTGIGNADRGLDACFNEEFGTYYLYVSYIDRSNRMNIFGRQNQTGPEQDEAGILGR